MNLTATDIPDTEIAIPIENPGTMTDILQVDMNIAVEVERITTITRADRGIDEITAITMTIAATEAEVGLRAIGAGTTTNRRHQAAAETSPVIEIVSRLRLSTIVATQHSSVPFNCT